MGTKRSVLTDENGLPLAVVLSGANTHDVKLLEDTLDHILLLYLKIGKILVMEKAGHEMGMMLQFPHE